MEFDLELSSRIENRIDHELFLDESDDLSLPGMARRAAPMAHSQSDDTGLVQSSSFQNSSGDAHTLRHVEHILSPVHTDEAAEEQPNAGDLCVAELEERLLDSADSLSFSMHRSVGSETGQISFGTSPTERARRSYNSVGGVFAHEEDPVVESDNSVLQSPSTSRGVGVSSSAEKDAETFPMHQQSTTPDHTPPIEHTLTAMLAADTSTPLPTPPQSTSMRSTNASALRSMSPAGTVSMRSEQEPSHAFAPHTPRLYTTNTDASDILTVPNKPSMHANMSLPQIGEREAELLGTHVDPDRLVVYQDKLNKQLTAENEALKMQCDALMEIMQEHDIVLDTSRLPMDICDASVSYARSKDASAELHASQQHATQSASRTANTQLQDRIRTLESVVEEQQRRLDTAAAPDAYVLQRATDMVQEQHEQLLHDLDVALRDGTDLTALARKVRAALLHTHGLVNTLREVRTVSPDPAASVTHALHSISMDTNDAEQELLALHEKVRSHTNGLTSARAELKRAASFSEATSERKSRVEEQVSQIQRDHAELSAMLEAKTERLDQVREQYLETSQRRSHCRGGENEQEEQLLYLERALMDAQDQVRIAKEQQCQMERRLHVLNEEMQLASDRCERASSAEAHARKARLDCEAQLVAQIDEMAAVRRSLEAQSRELEEVRGEKDHMWYERRQILEQVQHFEQHLRLVRNETEQYGEDLERLREEKLRITRELGYSSTTVRELVAAAIKPRLQALYQDVHEERQRSASLVSQKTYLTNALRAQEWLHQRLCMHMDHVAPILSK
ncbi:hypothetical protein MVES_001856 [Malassezia vespertilionis]|uniref:Uncharacterized protein n=2 Tax=Malassezia vespertilionis TaxID=2020962 RepID=A0A2N1JCM5_9BASI|nr:hypothetical protein MVES_001856 [Malassezia vespertilionis]